LIYRDIQHPFTFLYGSEPGTSSEDSTFLKTDGLSQSKRQK